MLAKYFFLDKKKNAIMCDFVLDWNFLVGSSPYNCR